MYRQKLSEDTTTASEDDRTDTVAVIITTFNDTEFLPFAIKSVLSQTRPADEIIVVDDGSDESPAALVASFSRVTFLRKSNGGLSSARNFGLRVATSSYITFLDADDLLLPRALASGLACFFRQPQAAMVYGGHRRIGAGGEPLGLDHVQLVGEDVYGELLTTNFIGMHATVLYRREILEELGGFDESLRMCEDYDLYLRLARRHPVAGHSEVVAEYRRHARNMSSNSQKMLEAVLIVHDRHKSQVRSTRKQAWHAGQQHWRSYYRPKWLEATEETGAFVGILKRVARSVVRRTKNRLRGGRIHRVWRRTVKRWPPVFGDLRFGDFGSTKPVAMDYGYERGNPVDRYYIEKFLEQNSSDIRGRVLEVGEDTYSKKFGGAQIVRQDVLHYNQPDPIVTILGDLTQPGILPEAAFDCIILTQTLQLIFNLEQAVTRLHAALKPGGVLLLTVPGITSIERTEWARNWYWSFTEFAIVKLFEASFAPEELQITQFGNVFSASMFLYGVAHEELDARKLDVYDEAYPVIIGLRATRRS